MTPSNGIISVLLGEISHCKRSTQEWLECDDLVLFHTNNDRNSWQQLTIERTLWSRLILAASDWPPTLRAVGWRNGKIVILHVDFHKMILQIFDF